MRTYDVWKTVPYNSRLDHYYAVLHNDTPYTKPGFCYSSDELIQTGFKSYKAGLDFIQVLQKLKGVNNER